MEGQLERLTLRKALALYQRVVNENKLVSAKIAKVAVYTS